MHIKRFRGKTLDEALREVKEAFGQDAIIISTKNGKGIAEVIAAIDFDVEEIEQNLGSNDELRKGISGIKEEINELRTMFATVVDEMSMSKMAGNGKGALSVYEELVDSGLNEKLTRRLIKMAAVATSGGPRELKKRCFQLLMDKTGLYNPLGGSDAQKLLAFVGPSGSGKTATIAKLAGGLRSKYRANIAVVNLTDGKPLGSDAIKQCGRTFGFPVKDARSKEEFNSSVWSLRDKDVILIDTPGINPSNKKKIRGLRSILDSGFPVKKGLVLNVTSRDESQYDACRGFAELKPDCLAYTRLDETRQRGTIINTAAFIKKPIAYLCDGQKIPYDIKVASNEIVECLVANGGEVR